MSCCPCSQCACIISLLTICLPRTIDLMHQNPSLSLLVVVYDMPRQAMNTLYSLCSAYQSGIDEQDYEVVVVENRSQRNLVAADVLALGNNFHYVCREESGVSPVPALQFGLQQCRGERLGLIVDGARMLSPRALCYAQMAFAMQADAVVTVPGYHLGSEDQKNHLSAGHDEASEERRLAELNWRENGYRLFQYACWSSGNKNGYVQPMLESSALFSPLRAIQDIGGVPAGFDQAGGGSVNLYLYRKLALREQARLFVLPGEGSFHQFHAGVTTSEVDGREAQLAAFDARLEEIYGGAFKSTAREPQLLGAVSHYAQPFLEQSLSRAQRRFSRLAQEQREFWDDENFDYWTENQPSKVAHLRGAQVKQWDLK